MDWIENQDSGVVTENTEEVFFVARTPDIPYLGI